MQGFGRMIRGASALLILAAVMFPRPALADTLAVVEAYLAAWNAHDAAAAAGYLAEDVTYYDASVGTPQVGREAARVNVIEAFLNAAPDANWRRVGDPVVTGDSVAFEWVFAGTNTGAWSDGTAATGKPFEIHGLSLFRVEGDEIVYQGDYYDAFGFYRQLGLK